MSASAELTDTTWSDHVLDVLAASRPGCAAEGHRLVDDLVAAGLPTPTTHTVRDVAGEVTVALTLDTADDLAAWRAHVDTTGAVATMRVVTRVTTVLTGRLAGARIVLERELDVRSTSLDADTVDLPRHPVTSSAATW